MSDKAVVISTPEGIAAYRLAVIEQGLRLESKGMRHSSGSVAKAAREELGRAGIKPKRTKVALYEQFRNWRTGNK